MSAQDSFKTENLGFFGYFEQTAEEGYSAICMTICSPCMLLVAIILVFVGEYNYVKDLNNIYEIEKDMVDGVTAYEAANNGKPVAFYASTINASSVTDSQFQVTLPNVFAIARKAYMVTVSVRETTVNNQKQTSCTGTWTNSKGTQGSNSNCAQTTYNNRNFRSPCPSGNSCDANIHGTATSAGFTINQQFLYDDYIGRTTLSAVASTSEFGGNWQAVTTGLTAGTEWMDCGTYLSNNYRTTHGSNPNARVCVNGYPSTQTALSSTHHYDHSVTFEKYNVQPVTICSKQVAGGTFEVLKSDGNYDIMIEGQKSKADCIKIMEDEATATVWIFRIIGFILFWFGFCMMFSIVTFLADRIGQLIPCGIGQAFEDMVQCLVAIVTCPPATACWLFWFALAWLIFRPLIGGIVFCVSLCLFGGMFYVWYVNKDDEASEDNAGKIEQTDMAEPWSSDQTPTQPPPSVPDNVDADGDGIPDKFQTGLPPNWSAAIDPSSNRVYWINHNQTPPQSTWVDPRATGPPPPME